MDEEEIKNKQKRRKSIDSSPRDEKTMFGKTNYSLVKKDEKLISGKLYNIYDELNTAESIMISSRTFRSKKDADALPNAINTLKTQLERRSKTYHFNNAIDDLNDAYNLALGVCKNLRCTIGNRKEREKIKKIRGLVETARESIEYELDGKLDQK